MDTLALYLGIALTTLAACTVLGILGLKGFTAWIALKHAELTHASPAPNTVGQRIDVADLKERVRRLEAIAAGVEI